MLQNIFCIQPQIHSSPVSKEFRAFRTLVHTGFELQFRQIRTTVQSLLNCSSEGSELKRPYIDFCQWTNAEGIPHKASTNRTSIHKKSHNQESHAEHFKVSHKSHEIHRQQGAAPLLSTYVECQHTGWECIRLCRPREWTMRFVRFERIVCKKAFGMHFCGRHL